MLELSLLAFSIVTPQFVPFLSDIILLLCFLCVFLRFASRIPGKSRHVVFSIVLLTLLSFVIALVNGLPLVRYLIPQFRPFLYVFILFNSLNSRTLSIISTNSFRSAKRLFFVLSYFIITFNLLALLDVNLYRSLNDLWNGPSRFVGHWSSTAASVVAPLRLSSFAPTPASSGLIHISCILILLVLKYRNLVNTKCFAFTYILLGISGLATLSSFFFYSFFALSLFYFLPRSLFPRQLRSAIPLFGFLLPILLLSLQYLLLAFPDLIGNGPLLEVFAGRIEGESNISVAFSSLSDIQHIFGADFSHWHGFRMPFGDNGYTSRLFMGGFLFSLVYPLLLYSASLVFVRYYVKSPKLFEVFAFFFILLEIGELGFNSFSQPGTSVIPYFAVVFCLPLSAPAYALLSHQRTLTRQ